MKKKMTPDQEAAYAERRTTLRKISCQIAAMSPDERLSLALQQANIVTCEGRPLSTYNCCMVIAQAADTTMIGGFQQWQRLGRKVQKGARAVYIWVPLVQRETDGSEGGIPDEKRFRLVAMFDVSMTEELAATEGAA